MGEAAEQITSGDETPTEENNLWASMAEDLPNVDETTEEVTGIGEGEGDTIPAAETVETVTPEGNEDSETVVTEGGEVEPQTPEAAAETQEKPQGEQAPAASEEVTPPAQPQETKTPEQLEQERQAQAKRDKELREKAVQQLAEGYKLSEDDATKMLTNPEEVLPKFAATVMLDVYDAVVKNIMTNLPQLIQQVQLQQEAISAQEQAFYQANPLLNPNEHKDIVNRYAQAYLQVNPNAKAEDVYRDVGIQVMFALGIDPNKGKEQPQESSPQPTQQVVKPHTPAGVSTPSTPSASKGDDLWGQLADELLTDEF